MTGLFTANAHPRQVAYGAALGMMLGLLPKGNLLAIILGVLLMAFRVNRTAGLLAVAAFSGVGMQLDAFSHRLGSQALSLQSLQSFYAWLYDLPLGPWLGFNNTVVMGSLLIGLYAFYPMYLIVYLSFSRLQPPAAKWIARYRLGRWLLGADWTERLGLPGAVGLGS